MTMADHSKNTVYTLDDRHEVFSLYRSQCSICKHFVNGSYSCAAYPGGIPESLLDGSNTHNKKRLGQKGDFVFEQRNV